MQAVIAAGGKGTRMMPLTRDVPKCLLPVNGVPFIDHILFSLKDSGYTDVILLVSHYGGQVVKWCRDGARYGLDIEYSWDTGEGGVAGAIGEAYDQLDDTFLLTYGDVWLNIDYAAPLAMLRNTGVNIVMSVWPHDGTAHLKANVAIEGGVCRYANKDENPRFVEAGALAYRKAPTVTNPPAYAYRLDGFERPFEIGSPEGYAATCRRLAGARTLPYSYAGER